MGAENESCHSLRIMAEHLSEDLVGGFHHT